MPKIVVDAEDIPFAPCDECGRSRPIGMACICEIEDDLPEELKPHVYLLNICLV